MIDKELKALISLLDDPDTEIYSSVEEKIISLGDHAIANLEETWENSFNHVLQSRIELVIHKIQINSLTASLKAWSAEENNDLLEGVLLVAKYQYPDLNDQEVFDQLESLKKDIWLELNDNLTALEKVQIMNKILFDIRGFRGNKTNYHAPQNSFINTVLESKKGGPLMLSIIYMTIAKELKIPIYGINLPEHFVLGYSFLPRELVNNFTADDILFYINPFSRGQVFSKNEIDAFLNDVNLPQNELFYLPCTNNDIIKRLLRNLSASYQKLGYTEKEIELNLLLKSIS